MQCRLISSFIIETMAGVARVLMVPGTQTDEPGVAHRSQVLEAAANFCALAPKISSAGASWGSFYAVENYGSHKLKTTSEMAMITNPAALNTSVRNSQSFMRNAPVACVHITLPQERGQDSPRVNLGHTQGSMLGLSLETDLVGEHRVRAHATRADFQVGRRFRL